MMSIAWLLPAALTLGLLALAAFVWALSSGQFEDLDGAAWRAIADDEAVEAEGGDLTRGTPAPRSMVPVSDVGDDLGLER
jgi:cbb3-type cytochrome oxidase maturation protein